MKRTIPLRRTSTLRRVGLRRRTELSTYTRRRNAFLAAHPFCQLTIAHNELDETEVLEAARGYDLEFSSFRFRGIEIPRATEIHHRNKRTRDRLNDERWWMAVSRKAHEWIEANKAEARSLGYLLPIDANKDGLYATIKRGRTTEELMKARARGRVES